MSCILNIDTSTAVCSVALSNNQEIVFNKVSFDGPSHAALLGVYVQEALDEAVKRGLKPDAVAVSSGPGSYTGLRIGVSMAKGLCFGYDIPLISLHTLDIMASEAIAQNGGDKDMLYCAMLDARRMEVYAAIYDAALKQRRPDSADIIDTESYKEFLEGNKICFFGNGAEKCKPVITHPNAIFLDDIHPLASAMAPLALKAFEEKRFVDVAYFEPFYLKEFQATIAKNKVLNR